MEEIKQIWCAEDSCYYPEIKVENGRTYKLDTEHFVYLEQLDFGFTEEEQELMRNPIDRWGNAWRKFMQENYPNEAAELKKSNRWDELALEIDREAHSLWELLRKQYSKANPRPTTFMETMEWENTRGFYVDHEVMEQVVLQFRA